MHPTLQVDNNADLRNLVAVATQRHVLLLDSRRPAAPLVQWAHGLEASPPTLVTLHCSPDAQQSNSPRPGAARPATDSPRMPSLVAVQPAAVHAHSDAVRTSDSTQPGSSGLKFRGLVVVVSPATGAVLAFPFALTGGAGPVLAARNAAPAEGWAQKSRRRAAHDHRFPGDITGTLTGAAAFLRCETLAGTARAADSPAFAWSPLLSADLRAGLPWRVCSPLGRGADDGPVALRTLRPALRGAHDEETLPDLHGVCLVPWLARYREIESRHPLRALLIRYAALRYLTGGCLPGLALHATSASRETSGIGALSQAECSRRYCHLRVSFGGLLLP